MNIRRPNPEELLGAVERLRTDRKRGRLKVFLGMCPGVGKTYSMLRAAREQQLRTGHVVIGVVETHGRRETQVLLEGIKVLSKITVNYKDTSQFEMDLDLILKERPQLVLVDELAHTNIPGLRHIKRYQDVEEILAAGIDVYTTVNIQHIESRNDQVAQITGVSVKETVPDSFFELADEIEVIDLSPNELLRRLNEGKVYLGERAELAAKNFFKEEYLTALRELALRFVAERVDRSLQDQMLVKGIEGPWNINERLLVAVSHSPYSSRLIREARRKAYTLDAPWIALYVDLGNVLSTEDQLMLQKNLNLARELGAEVISMIDLSLEHAIQTISQDKNVTQIILGRPDRRFFRDLLARGTFLDQLVRTTSTIDIHIVRAERPPKYRGFNIRWPTFHTKFVAYYNTAWFIAAVSVLCFVLLPTTGYPALGSVFLFAILIVASVAQPGPIFFAAILCSLIWNFFFIPPQFTFVINSWADTFMVLSFFLVAVVGGLLTARIKKQEGLLQKREQRARSLYEFAKNLSEATNETQILDAMKLTVDRQFGGKSLTLLAVPKTRSLQALPTSVLSSNDFAVAVWTFEHGKPAGWSTQTLSAAKCLCIPLRGNSEHIGVFVLYPNNKEKSLSPEQENFVYTVFSQASIAIERLRFSEAAQATKLYEASEKLHHTLINSVSHELRTPLTTIIGTSTALKEKNIFDDESARMALTDELVKSARRLDRVVENLLDMSRLESGTLTLKKEWFETKDLFDSVKSDLSEELGSRSLITLGNIETLIEGNFRLLQHALSNLVQNAIKYSPANTAVEIEVSSRSESVCVSVKDHGSGIPSGAELSLFEKFYRLPGTPAGGLGLGLSIVKSIVELHGGQIYARNRDGENGAIFEWELPMTQTPQILKELIG
jgi:two-component system sensor histidine kinase KdpD